MSLKALPNWGLILLAIIELLAFIFISLKIRKLLINYRQKRKERIEPYLALRLSLSEILFSPAAEFLTNDLYLFYSVLAFPFRKKPKENGKKFTYHKKSFYQSVFAMVLALMIFEGIIVHVTLIFILPHRLFWIFVIVLCINIYAIVWLVGDYLNIYRRPHLLKEKNLILRLGIRLLGIIEYSNIEFIKYINQAPLKKGKKKANKVFFALKDKCNVYFRLKNPINVYSFFGVKSGINEIFMYLDMPQEFIDELREKHTNNTCRFQDK